MRPIRRRAKPLKRLLGDRGGATAIEYGLIAAVIVVVMVVTLRDVAETTVGMWNNVGDTVIQTGAK